MGQNNDLYDRPIIINNLLIGPIRFILNRQNYRPIFQGL